MMVNPKPSYMYKIYKQDDAQVDVDSFVSSMEGIHLVSLYEYGQYTYNRSYGYCNSNYNHSSELQFL